MATYKDGINGPIKGKVGSVIASCWRGIYYLKSVAEKSSKPASPAQLRQREAFSMVSTWLKPLKTLIWTGFQAFNAGKTPMNEAISFVMKAAVSVEAEEVRINYSSVVFSRGDLLPSTVQEILDLGNDVLRIKWDNFRNSTFCKADDKATFVFYNPAKGEFATFEHIADRGDKMVDIQFPVNYTGDVLHAYMYFVNASGNLVSTTVYLGEYKINC